MTVAPDVLRDLRAQYQRDLEGEDPVRRAVAREQLERLELGARRGRADQNRQATEQKDGRLVHWSIRPYRRQLLALLEASGNGAIRWRGSDCFQTGHQPFHTSKSGTCLVVWLDTGTFWCSSCHAVGGAIEWLAAWKGISRRRAHLALAQKFGNGAP